MLLKAAVTIFCITLISFLGPGCITMIKEDSPPADVHLQEEVKALEAEFMARNRVIFTCSHWHDTDGDGQHDFPLEFMGVKRRFLENQDMLLVAMLNGKDIANRPWTIKIYGPDDQEIENCGNVLTSNSNTIILGIGHDENLAGWLTSLGGTGNYTALLYLADTLESMCEFELVAAEKDTPGGFHTVQRGETLYSIARRFNTTVQDLVALNQIRDANRLSVGQQVQIPIAPRKESP